MSLIQFESLGVNEAKRQALREARQKILTDAEAAYHRKQAQAQRAKELGNDRWMLPSVEAKLASNESPKRKKKKEKKSKKSKKKKRKHKESSFDSDSSVNKTEEWVEKSAKPTESKTENSEPEKQLERDEWMSLPGSFLCSLRDEKQKKMDAERKACETYILDAPGQNTKELNPYWRDRGTGLPEQEKDQCNRAKLMDAAWLKKSLQRAQEQAEEEGKSLDEIAAERWGSLDAIQSMIKEAENNSRRNYGPGKNWHKDTDKSSYSRRDYTENVPGNRRRDEVRSHERPGTNNPYPDERSRYREDDRSRSRSHERTRRPSSNRENERRFCSERTKMAFMKPNENDHSSASTSGKSSSAVRRWQKPEINEKIYKEKNLRKSENPAVREQLEKLLSDQSNSGNEEREKIDAEGKKIATEDVMTEAKMNQLGAKIVKAEIMGDMELAERLKAKLELARETRKTQPAISHAKKPAEEETVILTKFNTKGMARPLEPRSLREEPAGGRRKGKKVDTHKSGKRVRYFADDDKFTLKEMFQREKGQSSAENDATFVKMASKSMDMNELFEQRITREDSDAKQDARDRMRAIKDHKKLEKSLDHCRSCFDSEEMLKHLIVAMGTKTYVSLPSHVSLTAGHCLLAPIHHVSCQTQLDEDVWEELQNFKKGLTKMFMGKNEFPVFFEMSVGQHRFPHMQVECVPLPDEVGSMAPIYFKKALLECETEWSTNKKVVDLSNKNVRQAIPKGLPYFAVSFGNHGGFAHVIENEKAFPRNFAQEIIGGILDLDHNLWRKPKRENFDQQRKKVLEFAALWNPYDLTTTSDR